MPNGTAKVTFQYNSKQTTVDIPARQPCCYVAGGFQEVTNKLGIKESLGELYISLPGGQHGDLFSTQLPTTAGQKYGPIEIKVRKRELVGPQTSEDKAIMNMVPEGNAKAYYMPKDKEQVLSMYDGQYQEALRKRFSDELMNDDMNNTPVLVMPGASVRGTLIAKGYKQPTECPVIISEKDNKLNIWVPPLGYEDVHLVYPEDERFSTIPITYQNGIVLFNDDDFKVAMRFPGNPINFPFEEETKAFEDLVGQLYENNKQITSAIQQNNVNTDPRNNAIPRSGYNSAANHKKENNMNIMPECFIFNNTGQESNHVNTIQPNNQNEKITLTCVNWVRSGLNSADIVIDDIAIEKDQTISDLKDKILAPKNDSRKNLLQKQTIHENDFVVCTVDKNKEPVNILSDNERISDVFSNNKNYVIVPRQKIVRIKVDNAWDYFYNPVIVNNNNKDEFNTQSWIDVITKKLAIQQKAIDYSKTHIPDWLTKKGWEIVEEVDDCFSRFLPPDDSLNITTKNITKYASDLNHIIGSVNNTNLAMNITTTFTPTKSPVSTVQGRNITQPAIVSNFNYYYKLGLVPIVNQAVNSAQVPVPAQTSIVPVPVVPVRTFLTTQP